MLRFLLLGFICFTYAALPAQLANRYKKLIPKDEKIIVSTYQFVQTRQADKRYRLRIFYPERFQLIEDISMPTKNFNSATGRTPATSIMASRRKKVSIKPVRRRVPGAPTSAARVTC